MIRGRLFRALGAADWHGVDRPRTMTRFRCRHPEHAVFAAYRANGMLRAWLALRIHATIHHPDDR
ncbi:MAG: hypothetical protein KGK35_04195, partial [Xanthomonadaceae bacterium]|nr:hypothetical protein [Xanthomonadaceae bacterium]